ncbi:hypothetical protein EW146_g6758 [Bondarzewia mesenterica]|uniref:Acyl-CoA oxidase C-alpha1 domain-containing protein n=1 Tax=Bondarzewia mesenterica TaxID=1095465 RepID=A0A4S4LMN4_9AGAM|nr:hypothetical protein EW146_g6758 [Bondarzewia mesenterica]
MQTHRLTSMERARLSYERAKAIGFAYQMNVEDIASLGPKFWACHADPMAVYDGAATTLLTIQYNLVIGTLVQYTHTRDDLTPFIDDLLKYRKIGQFLLTERGHGLDAENLETTATLLSTGEFLLLTPSSQAAKYMPPTVPVGVPCIGIVFARLIVAGKFHGIRPFVVDINDGMKMCAGVTARLLPPRGGTNPVNHCLTYFNQVRLPRSALLGSIEKSAVPHNDFLQSIWRVTVGSIALGFVGIGAMEVFSTIGALYSMRRTVGPDGARTPIFHFRTQQIPVLTVTAQVYVLKAFSQWAIATFSDTTIDSRVRRGIAACTKAVIVQHSQAAALSISDRCGAQGLFEINQMSTMFNEMRGIAIAEGDILALSIRLTTELLIGRYELPRSTNPDSLLSRHETSIFEEHRTLLAAVSHHRNHEVNRQILPHCQAMVEAIGHRMAYDAAVASGVLPCLIDLYVASVIKLDPAWYAEQASLGRPAQVEMENAALDAVLPHLDSLVSQLDIQPYVTAPIVSDGTWDAFVNGLECFEGKVSACTEDKYMSLKHRL